MPVTPVPTTDVRYTGVTGRPLPVVSWLVNVQPLEKLTSVFRRARGRPRRVEVDRAYAQSMSDFELNAQTGVDTGKNADRPFFHVAPRSPLEPQIRSKLPQNRAGIKD